ncbi:hypothetical protein CSPX01_09151 [Colletotrichum filicis]|nr:hypothetical protein CSPX01_09151 [Colletotrichum filicis]
MTVLVRVWTSNGDIADTRCEIPTGVRVWIQNSRIAGNVCS